MSAGRDYKSVPERITWTTGFRVATDKLVLGALSTFANFETGKDARMSLKKLVSRARLPRRTVQRGLHRLEQDGWVSATRRHRHATSWDIVVDRLAKNWVGATVVEGDLCATGGAQLSATGGAQDPDLSATGGAQTADLCATGGAPIPCTYRSPVVQNPGTAAAHGADPPSPQQLAFSPMEVRPALAPDPIPTPAVRDPWARVLARIETKVNRHTFYTWWRETVLVEDRGDVLVVRAANERDKHDIIAAWIEKHYAELLAEALAAVRSGARVEFLFAIRQASVQQRKSG